jgi:hypothetical protein
MADETALKMYESAINFMAAAAAAAAAGKPRSRIRFHIGG